MKFRFYSCKYEAALILFMFLNSLGGLCDEELELLKSWEPDEELEPSKQKWLVTQGELELFGIGSRFKRSFPEAFPALYDPETFKVWAVFNQLSFNVCFA